MDEELFATLNKAEEMSFQNWKTYRGLYNCELQKLQSRIEAQDKRNKELEVALLNLIEACDAGKIVSKPGACGMTIEAQTRHSWINRVEAWSVEEARAALGGEKKDD